jgi:toxin CptA
MKSVPAVAFDYRPSGWLIAALSVAATSTLFAIASSGIDAAIKYSLATLTAIYVALALRRFYESAPTHVAWHSTGQWRLVDAVGNEYAAELRGFAIRGAWIVLNLRNSERRRIDLILAPDNSDAETRRLLRVRLSRNAEVSRA